MNHHHPVGVHDLLMVGIEEERMGYDDKSNGEEILPPTQSLPHSLSVGWTVDVRVMGGGSLQ